MNPCKDCTDDQPCQACCDHSDVEDTTCLICGDDITENLLSYQADKLLDQWKGH